MTGESCRFWAECLELLQKLNSKKEFLRILRFAFLGYGAGLLLGKRLPRSPNQKGIPHPLLVAAPRLKPDDHPNYRPTAPTDSQILVVEPSMYGLQKSMQHARTDAVDTFNLLRKKNWGEHWHSSREKVSTCKTAS